MKTSIIVLLTLITLTVSAQDTINVPEYSGNIEYLSDPNIKLEQLKASGSSRSNKTSYIPYAGMVAGKTIGMNLVKGDKSPVRFTKGSELRFIAKVNNNDIDPFLVFNIFKLDVNTKKKYRHIDISSISSVGKSTMLDIQFVKFEAQKHGDKYYIIKIIDPLEEGEYAITLEGYRSVFNLFGID